MTRRTHTITKKNPQHNQEWSWEEMNGFLIKPSKWIKGNKMGFAGLKKDEDRPHPYVSKDMDMSQLMA